MKILKNKCSLDYKSFVFSGGEVSIKLNANNYKYLYESANHQTIIARIQNSNDFFELANIKDALARFDNTKINLFLPYVPYARQDRVCDKGESFSLQVFTKLLNSLKFNEVIICDPHSEVAPALIDNVRVITQFDLINKSLPLLNRIVNCTLISPDSGGNKKTSEIAKLLNHNEFIRADKLRDLTNGNIKETIVYCDDFKGRDVAVIDDICDGGRTFTELAKVCKAKNCGKFILYVTHGIFSKGVETLIHNGIDEIWTTNSFNWFSNNLNPALDDKVNVMNLEERFADFL